MISLEEGKRLVKIARSSIISYFTKEKVELKKGEKARVFVSLHKNSDLRGCIGYIEAIFPLEEAVFRAARAAAFSDPRFPPVQENELNKITIEISILTKPELIKVNNPTECLNKIKIGEDGLIVEYGQFSGLLLPQVPIEQNWDKEEFLQYTCLKANLPADTWRSSNCKIYKFQVQIFSETNKGIIEKHLKK